MENKKLKVGVYIDGANIFYTSKNAGWKIDFKKFKNWIEEENEIIYIKYFIGSPSWEPAKSLSQTFNNYLIKLGYSIIGKPLKKINIANGVTKNKCNFDVEIHDEIMQDIASIDIVYLVSGDSDFMRTKSRVLANKKKIKFLVFNNGCAWEIRKSWHIFLDDIKQYIERGI